MRSLLQGSGMGALIALLFATAVYADDPPYPTEPPQVRGAPPIGVSVRMLPPSGITTQDDPPQMRIGPPSGITASDDPPQGRLGPPIGITAQEERSTFFELFWLWLQMRIGPPIG